MWDEPLVFGKGAQLALIRNHKRCYLVKTAARWSWKSTSAKNCV